MKKFTFLKFFFLTMLLSSAQWIMAQTNIAPLATASHSGGGSGTYGPQNYNDGVITTGTFGWVSGTGGTGMWIQFDWSTPQNFDKVRFYPDQAGTRTLTAGDIEYWNGSAWVLSTQFTVSPSTMFDVTLNNPVNSTKMRIINMTVTGSQSSNPSLNEIEIFEAILAANNASVAALDSPSVFCEGTHNIVATVANRGINQIDSVRVNWSFNGVGQQTYFITSTLDTLKGSGVNSVQVVLGTKTFTSGVKDSIAVWTSMPNGVPDTFNLDDTIIAVVQPAIYGNFTIDPSGSGPNNYQSFTDAANDLSDFGVCGPVTFEVASGTYNEQFRIGEVSGASALNTVSFFPDSTGSVLVTFNSSSTDNYIVSLDGADYISFEDMTFETGTSSSYGAVVNIGNQAEYNSFNNCVLNGRSINTTSNFYAVIYAYSGAQNNGNMFMNCEINNGSYGCYFNSGSSVSTNDNLIFKGNKFKDAYYMGAYIYGSKDIMFNENEVNTNSTYTSSYGVYIYYTYDESQFVGNKIHYHYMGAYLYYWNGTATKKPLIANNWIVAENASYYSYGLYYYGGFTNIVHNTIWRETGSSYGYYGALIGGGANTFVNNILYSPSGSSSYYTYYMNGSFAISESDYNCFFTSQQFGYANGVIATFADWQSTTGFDMNSIYTDPGFASFDSVRTCNDTIDGAGTPLSYLDFDIDGDDRDPLHPDIGADEWIGNDSGAYSAGLDQLICDGKTATVGLNISGGTFLWNTTDTTPTITVTEAGIYTVAMTTDCGGSHVDTVEVIESTPVASFSKTVSFKTGQFTNTSQRGNSYMWIVYVPSPDTSYSQHLTYVFPDNGPYNVELTVFNDCDTVKTSDVWQGTVGIEESSLSNQISMMPNPASDVVTIMFNGVTSDDVRIELMNIQGQTVYTEQFINISGNTPKSIDVSSLNKGMYMIRFITDQDIATKQLIVK